MPGISVSNIAIPFKRKLESGFPSTLTDGTCSMRQVIRGDYLCTDLTLTALGFAGVENTDWECVESVSSYWNTLLDTWHKDTDANTWDSNIALMGDKTSVASVPYSTGDNLVIKDTNPDLIVSTGDFMDSVNDLASLTVNLGGFTGRIFASPGNHDGDSGDRDVFNAFFGGGGYRKVSTSNIDFFIYDVYLKEDESGYYSALETEARTIDSFKNSTQGQWLVAQLAASTAVWKVLVAHQPSWSSANPIADPNTQFYCPGLRWDWKLYNVDLVINGHVHFYERLNVPTGTGNVPIICIGTTGAVQLDWSDINEYSVKRFNVNSDITFDRGCVSLVKSNNESLLLEMYAISGSSYALTLPKDIILLSK